MKAAEATDGLRAGSGKPVAGDWPCGARDKQVGGGGGGKSSSVSCAPAAASSTTSKQQLLPNSHAAHTDDKKGNPAASAAAASQAGPDARRNQVLANLTQTGVVKSKGAPMVSAATAAGSMERRRCCCTEGLGGRSFHGSHNQSPCNCNMENCAWVVPSDEVSFPASHLKTSQPWRSSSDQSNTNAALHRALAAVKKVPHGEAPDGAAKPKALPLKPVHSRTGSDVHRACAAPQCDSDLFSARSITNPDARTLSMRERGRWGSSKMQQHHLVVPSQPACAGGGTAPVKPNLSPTEYQYHQHQHHIQQALQHVQCLHCGSFSTTPVSGIPKGGVRSHSFGRKVRDYTWQQELLQEQRRPEQPQVREAAMAAARQTQACGQNGGATPHHRCEYARCADMLPEYEQGSAPVKLQGGSVMSWQERYMLLCQAIAAGAFLDGDADDMSGPILPALRGYSSAVCECAACEMGGAAAFRRGPVGYCNTNSGERMMELEAFSGPLGYVSESKAGAELSRVMERRPRRRWWARLPGFGKPKGGGSNVVTAAGTAGGGRPASGQNTVQCCSCGQRVWGGEAEEMGGRLCPDCIVRTGAEGCHSGPIPGPTAARPTPPRAARPRPTPPPRPPFSSHHHRHMPRRWRLMKLCRYLMGFPLQR